MYWCGTAKHFGQPYGRSAALVLHDGITVVALGDDLAYTTSAFRRGSPLPVELPPVTLQEARRALDVINTYVSRSLLYKAIRPLTLILPQPDPKRLGPFERIVLERIAHIHTIRNREPIAGVLWDWEPGQVQGDVLYGIDGHYAREHFTLRGHTLYYRRCTTNVTTDFHKEQRAIVRPPRRPVSDCVFPEWSDSL